MTMGYHIKCPFDKGLGLKNSRSQKNIADMFFVKYFYVHHALLFGMRFGLLWAVKKYVSQLL